MVVVACREVMSRTRRNLQARGGHDRFRGPSRNLLLATFSPPKATRVGLQSQTKEDMCGDNRLSQRSIASRYVPGLSGSSCDRLLVSSFEYPRLVKMCEVHELNAGVQAVPEYRDPSGNTLDWLEALLGR